MVNENVKKIYLNESASLKEVIQHINSLRREVEFVNEIQNQEINKKKEAD